MDEDCLYLNIWTGAKSVDDRRPVLVWYFGGGYQWGYTREMEFDGERLARQGVVVVTVNYRVNVFGFLSHPQLTKEQPEAPSNFGSLDQKAGLEWVVRNIANFGGDPNKITIAGQSAGGASVMSQLACEENEGKISGALVMSGMIGSPYEKTRFGTPTPLATAEQIGKDFFEFLGVKPWRKQEHLMHLRFVISILILPRIIRVCILCVTVYSARKTHTKKMLEGRSLLVPLMAGNTSDEFLNHIEAKDGEQLLKKAEELFKDKADQFLSFEENKKQTPEGFSPVSGIEYSVKRAFFIKKSYRL